MAWFFPGVIESNWNKVVDNFDDMNLKEALLRGIYAYGFERPSAIQQRAILPCIEGRDVIAQAQSGEFISFFSLVIVNSLKILSSSLKSLKIYFLKFSYKKLLKSFKFSRKS